jgi:hypothetical protein
VASKANVTTASPTGGSSASAAELEQFKAEIFAYIDKAKAEILDAIRATQQQ